MATIIANSTTATTVSSSTLALIGNETSQSVATTMATLFTDATQLLSPSSDNSTVVNATSFGTITKSSSSLSPLHPANAVHSGLISGFIFQFALTVLFLIIILAAVYVIRKKHLDELRHHLLPRYNFDPAEDGEDWETELLDDQFEPSSDTNPIVGPGHRSSQLKLDTGLTHGLNIHKSNTNTPKSTSTSGGHGSSLLPNASSGLLSSSDSHGSSGRRMYTTERDPVV